MQTRIKTLSAELRKKYGLPRETGERPPPPEAPDEPQQKQIKAGGPPAATRP